VFIFLNILFFTPLGSFTSQVDQLKKHNFIFLFPQGWSFFTRDPKVDIFFFYKIEEGANDLISDRPFSLRNTFGLNRSTRYLFEETEHLGKMLIEEQWVACDKSFEDCASQIPDEKVLKVINTFPLSRLCGPFHVKRTRTTPLIYVNLDKRDYSESFWAARMNIQCLKK
jgi:antimicrobial peptide system SdpA family protein